MPLEHYQGLSRKMFNDIFHCDGDRRVVRSIDISEQFAERCLGVGSDRIFASVRALLGGMGHGSDPWCSAGTTKLIAENFCLAWVCCRIAWEIDRGTLEESIRKRLDPPYQNAVSKIIRGLGDYWEMVAEYTGSRKDHHPLLLPHEDASGHERYVTSTKRLVIPWKRDLAAIWNHLNGDWYSLPIAARVERSMSAPGIDERLATDLGSFRDALASGPNQRLRSIWKRIESYVDFRSERSSGASIQRRTVFIWEPSRHAQAQFHSCDLDAGAFADLLESDGADPILAMADAWTPAACDRLFLFTPTSHSAIWRATGHATSPISRLLAHRSLGDALGRLRPARASALPLGDDWLLVDIDPSLLPLDRLPEGLDGCPQLLRELPDPRISLAGGIRSAPGEYLVHPLIAPRIASEGASTMRMRSADRSVDLQPAGGIWSWPEGMPMAGDYRLEALDGEGQTVATRSVRFVDPCADRRGVGAIIAPPAPSLTLCSIHPAQADDPDEPPLLERGTIAPFWPVPATSDAICDATAWFTAAMYLGPRVGELASEPRPGFGWAVRFSATDDPLLTWIGSAVPPIEGECNADKGACRAWRKAFDRRMSIESCDADAVAAHRAYRGAARAAIAKDVRRLDLGTRPGNHLDLEPDRIVETDADPRLRMAMTFMAALARKANARPLCDRASDLDDAPPEPGRLLAWLPQILGLSDASGRPSPEIWAVIRLWQEIGILDIVPPATSSGLRWVARVPEWVRARIGDRLQMTLVGLVEPGWAEQLANQADAAGYRPCWLRSECPWAPQVLRCSIGVDQDAAFAAWAASHGVHATDIPWAGIEWPAWIRPLRDAHRQHSAVVEEEAAERGWSFVPDRYALVRTADSGSMDLWTVYRRGGMTKWCFRSPAGVRWSPVRDEAALLAALGSGLPLGILRAGASLIVPRSGIGELPLRLPLPIARLCSVLSASLPGPGPQGWRYPLPNRFMANALADRLGLEG